MKIQFGATYTAANGDVYEDGDVAVIPQREAKELLSYGLARLPAPDAPAANKPAEREAVKESKNG